MVESFKEYSSGIFQKIRDAEALHHEKLQEECQNQLEKFIRNEVPDSYTETLKMLFVDKDAIANGTGVSFREINYCYQDFFFENFKK